MEKGLCKIFQVFYQFVFGICPVHSKVKTILVPLYRIGKITAVCTIGDDKHLNKFEQRIFAIETFFGISMHLIKCFADSDTAFFQFYLNQWQSVDQYRHIIPIGLCSGLFKLVDNLHLVSGNILFVGKIDIFDMSVIKNKIIDMIIVNLTSLVYQGISRFIQIFFHKPQPFLVREHHIVKVLNLYAGISQQRFGRRNIRTIFIALTY